MLRQIQQISRCEIDEVGRLPKSVIYNDWHRYNIVQKSGMIKGLIDFDSVIQSTPNCRGSKCAHLRSY